MIPPRIKEVKALKDFWLEIIYVTGEIKFYDMKLEFDAKIYENLKKEEYFKCVKNSSTTVEWPLGEDMDPNKLYEKGVIKI